MGDVIGLVGHTVPLPVGGGDPSIISTLEKLLDEAKSGQILALAYCVYKPQDVNSYGWNVGAYGFHIGSCILALQCAYGKTLVEGVEVDTNGS